MSLTVGIRFVRERWIGGLVEVSEDMREGRRRI